MEFEKSQIFVTIQPEEKQFPMDREKAKTVSRLLETLGMRPSAVIVAREGTLLTPDVPIYAGQHILVRKVMSSG